MGVESVRQWLENILETVRKENQAENLKLPDQSSQYSRILHLPVQQVVVLKQAAIP